MWSDKLNKNCKEITIPVVVFLQCIKIKDNIWIDQKWQAVGVVPSKKELEETHQPILVSNINDEPIYQYNDFILKLVNDELDSYYQNIRSNNASVFIICRYDDNQNPVPFLITLSYDEAAIYMETDEIIYTVAIDIQIYQILERFVLENYTPEKRKKRKLVKGTAGNHYKQASEYI